MEKTNPAGQRWFSTTHWSVVLAVRDLDPAQSRAALERLCQSYWRPLYAFVRQQGQSPEDAEDLTQEFMARLLEKGSFERADPAVGRFRTYLLTSLRRFLISEWRKASSQKRGAGAEVVAWDTQAAERCHASTASQEQDPERIYDRCWAVALMERVVGLLQKEYAAAGRGPLFESLKHLIWEGAGPVRWAEIAAAHGTNENGVRRNLSRLRQRCREVLRLEVAHTVGREEEIDEELRYLLAVLNA